MKLLSVRTAAILVATPVALFLLIVGASVALIESEEVVVIHTHDEDGSHWAHVWVVDFEGRQWIAPGNESNAWYQRLRARPRMEMERAGESACYLATAIEGPAAIPVLELLLEKYASVFRVTGLLNFLLEPESDDSPPTAIRLDPC